MSLRAMRMRPVGVRQGRGGAASRGLKPGVEPLEVREVLSLTFNFSIVDPTNAFGAYPNLKMNFQAAGQILGRSLDSKAPIDVRIVPFTDTTVATIAAATPEEHLVGTANGGTIGVYEADAEIRANTGTDPDTANPEIVVQVNTAYLAGNTFNGVFYQDYLDPSGAFRTSTLPSTKLDFLSVATHEMLHGLGFVGDIARNTNGGITGNHASLFDTLTNSGYGDGYAYFLGANAEAAYGNQKVPLTNDFTYKPGTNFTHVGNVTSGQPGYDLRNDLMAPSIGTNQRRAPSALDVGVMVDIGWARATRHHAAVADDFDGDGKSDISVYDPASNTYYIQESTGGFVTVTGFGGPNWLPVPADYDGDGVTDLAAVDPSTYNWYSIASSTGGLSGPIQFGFAGATPVTGDFNGDGKSDQAVFDTSNGNWYYRNSTTGALVGPTQCGGPNWLPVPGDYDGDGKTDLAVVEPATAYWYYIKSSTATLTGPIQCGGAGWNFVPGDYNGDGKTDPAAVDPSNGYWYYVNTTTLTTVGPVQVGGPNWLFVPGDYDGDGKTDRATVNPSTYQWYVLYSSTNTLSPAFQFGAPSWVPLELPDYLRKKKITG